MTIQDSDNAAQLRRLPDDLVIALYKYWSEEFYSAGFMSPDEYRVKGFIDHLMWLLGIGDAPGEEPGYADYELDMVKLYRELLNVS